MDATRRLHTPALLDSLTSRLEGASWLDGVAEALQKLPGAIPPGRVKDALSGTDAGHPLHPALVALPIGTFVSVAVLDALGDRRAARKLLGFGILTVAPTAAAGVSDWGDTGGGERRVGLVHALCNVASTLLMVASWFRRGRGRSGRGLSTVGLGLLGVSGWLGGHLAYARGVGVDVTAFEDDITQWTDAFSDDALLADQPVVARVGRNDVLLVRHDGQVLAMSDRCSHRGGPLHEGELVDGCVQCPWHGSRFLLADGSLARGPASRPQPAYETQVVSGRVQVRTSPAAPKVP